MPIAYLLTALTGAAGLVYQVSWLRYLGRLLGSDSLATATVLGVFLGGLSLGYLCWGHFTERRIPLLRLYGLLEAIIGVWALLFPWLYGLVELLTDRWSFATRFELLWQGALASVLLIGVPTVCMGATVPLLTRALSRNLARATAVHARIYAFNTAGALVGTLAAGFALVHWLGLPATVRAAGVCNLLAAAYFIRRGGVAESVAPEPPQADGADRSPWAIYAIGLLGGFAFMTLESTVIRVASLSAGSSSAMLSSVIAAFLLCIAVGAFFVGRLRHRTPSALFRNQLIVTFSLMPLFMTLDEWPYFAHRLRNALGFSLSDYVAYQIELFAMLCLLLLVPVGAMGATLPLAFDGLKQSLRGVGRTAGALFAWNALGNLAGGFVGGFLAYKQLSIGELFLLVIGLSACGCVLAALRLPASSRWLAAVACAAALIMAVVRPSHDPLRFAVGTFHIQGALPYSDEGATNFYKAFHSGREILAYRDDPEATLAVVENPRFADALREQFPSLGRALISVPSAFGEAGPPPRSILINGKADSSTFYDRETLRLTAHLPALVGERREKILIVGLGTGVTAGEFALYDDVRRIDVAEIAPGVVELLPYFSDWTHGVHEDPRLKLFVGDAFRLLRRAEQRWDLVISQPSNPWTRGVDQLFSRDFYRLVARRLESDGLLLQWMQRYGTTEEISSIAINTLHDEFPHIRIFRAGSDDLILAGRQPITDAGAMRADALLSRNDALRRSLAELRIHSFADLIAREHPEVVARALELDDGRRETLDHPRIHFLAGLAFFRGDDADSALFAAD